MTLPSANAPSPDFSAKDRAPTILMVDDSPVNLGVVVDALECHGYEVLVALDGEEALQRIAVVRPDVILLDIMMPGPDGFEVCRRLKAQAETRDIPVIFMTSLSGTSDKVAGFDVGAVDYLTKPLQVDEVKARVDLHLRLRTLQQQLEDRNAVLQQEIAARRLAEMALRQREQEFRALVENSPNIILRFDIERRCIYANQAAAQLAGEPVEALLDGGLGAIQALLPAQVRQLDCGIDRVFSTREAGRIPALAVDRNEIQCEIDFQLVPEMDSNGWVATVLVIGHELSARTTAKDRHRAD